MCHRHTPLSWKVDHWSMITSNCLSHISVNSPQIISSSTCPKQNSHLHSSAAHWHHNSPRILAVPLPPLLVSSQSPSLPTSIPSSVSPLVLTSFQQISVFLFKCKGKGNGWGGASLREWVCLYQPFGRRNRKSGVSRQALGWSEAQVTVSPWGLMCAGVGHWVRQT